MRRKRHQPRITNDHIEDLVTLKTLLENCCSLFGVSEDDICLSPKKEKQSFARAMFCYITQHPSMREVLKTNCDQNTISRFIACDRSRVSVMANSAKYFWLYVPKFRNAIAQTDYKVYFELLKIKTV